MIVTSCVAKQLTVWLPGYRLYAQTCCRHWHSLVFSLSLSLCVCIWNWICYFQRNIIFPYAFTRQSRSSFSIDLLLSGCNRLVMKLYRNLVQDLIQMINYCTSMVRCKLEDKPRKFESRHCKHCNSVSSVRSCIEIGGDDRYSSANLIRNKNSTDWHNVYFGFMTKVYTFAVYIKKSVLQLFLLENKLSHKIDKYHLEMIW